MNTAKIIAVTESYLTTNDGPMCIDDFIAYVARVSNPENQNNSLTAPKLLKYLVKHKHWSPFEMVNVVMEVSTTRDIARQILRHRSFSFQEFSQRYADPTQSLGFTLREARLQDQKNRQNSVETDDAELQGIWEVQQKFVKASALTAYNWAIKKGIAKEQARAVLPEGLTNSRLYMNGTLRSYIHWCQLRMKNGTQKEHSEVAKAAWGEIITLFPSLKDISLDG